MCSADPRVLDTGDVFFQCPVEEKNRASDTLLKCS